MINIFINNKLWGNLFTYYTSIINFDQVITFLNNFNHFQPYHYYSYNDLKFAFYYYYYYFLLILRRPENSPPIQISSGNNGVIESLSQNNKESWPSLNNGTSRNDSPGKIY